MTHDITGIVLRIERCSIHDGPGLRTVIYLKGCPLSCRWCSTPESQSFKKQVGHDPRRCTGCGTCVASCPADALSIVSGEIRRDLNRCTHCFGCAVVCPQNSHRGYGTTMSVAETVEEISKDEIFFFHSGGGVTISGGECFSQPDFTAAVLQECNRCGIDTAVETSFFSSWSSIEQSLPFLNTIYVDLKHANSDKHKDLIGAGNEIIYNNLRKLETSAFSNSLIIRIPLIPGVNDDDENLLELLAAINSLTKVAAIEILPYHRLGVSTYPLLDRKYQLETYPSPSENYLQERLSFLKGQDHTVAIKLGSGYH